MERKAGTPARGNSGTEGQRQDRVTLCTWRNTELKEPTRKAQTGSKSFSQEVGDSLSATILQTRERRFRKVK